MQASRTHLRDRLSVLVAFVLAAAGLQAFTAAPVQAAPSTGLVIAEFYGNGGNAGPPAAVRNADFIELWNMSASSINLSTYSVQYRAAASTAIASAAPLSGTIDAGGRFLVRLSTPTANGTGLPTPDYIASGVNAGGTNGQIFLVNGTAAINPGAAGNISNPAVVDFLGFGTAGSFEAAAATGVTDNTKSFTRSTLTVDGDNNSTDFGATVPTPQNAAGETEPAVAVTPTIATIAAKTGTVGTAITGFTATATGGTGAYTWSANGTLPPGVVINASTGAVSGTPTTAGPYDVVITVSDSTSPTPQTDTEAFTFTINAAPTGPTPIADIQGSTGTSPLAGQTVTSRGVVTAKYPTGGFNGFYMQTPGPDTTSGKSDAIFVFTPSYDDSVLAIGQSVEVTGQVSEYTTSGANTLTEITATSVAGITSLGTVVPKTVIPGTDCALPGDTCLTLAQADAAKEAVEGELFQPSGAWTATDVYDGSATNPSGSGSSSFFGEIGLAANSALPLIAPTELYDTQTEATALANRKAYNDAHRVVLDDGSSTTFWNTTNDAAGKDQTLPWFTQTHQVRVGAAVSFTGAPVILENRFGWKIQPTRTVVGEPTSRQPQFVQDRPAAPAGVGGDLKLATFNVLNYFTTLGANWTAGGTCSPFIDRQGNPIAVNSCPGNGPRGAWNTANFLRQQAKIVNAINTMNADIVSLEEIENSRKVDSTVNRDEALAALVNALNTAAGSTRWAFVRSPGENNLPPVAEEDVIRTAFIYNPAKVGLVGPSRVLVGSAPFTNAREPLAQAFKAKGAPKAAGFAVIVNHFKSKGATGATGDNLDTGQGAYTGDRTRQAAALRAFATQFATDRGVAATFLTGDFNAYSKEDPAQDLTDNGWVNLESTDDPDEESYSFDGSSGSLDHVFANGAADDMVTGVDIWEINGNETVFNQYSRYNYVGTDLYNSGPFSASDHNPEIVGINVPDVTPAATKDIQILGTNDFHGRLLNDAGAPTAGAAVLAGAVKQLRAENPDTAFVAAGDLIGASTFESFIQKDKPTIDALNEAGLDVSAAGNHEFDQGYNDLVNRVMAPYDATTNPFGGAKWKYIAANVRKKVDDSRALAPTWTQDFGDVRVGYVGAVTEHLDELVAPGGIADIKVTDIVTEVNASAADLKAGGADIVVMLVHEGAPTTNCGDIAALGTDTDFGAIVKGVSDDVDAIVSGHTHLAYDCSFPVAGWSSRAVTERPVVSAGQYGMALNQIVFTVNATTGAVQAKSQALLNLKTCLTNCAGTGTPTYAYNFPADPATQTIVDAAVTQAEPLGAVELGRIAGPMKRAKFANGTSENRGGESDLGNLVAEVQRWATSTPTTGSAQIAFMNPGGLRDDMLGTPNAEGQADYPRKLTYKQAAVIQPFANTLVNEDLTGAQVKAALEQQWQPAGASRPFLKLGISKGFTYTSDPTRTAGNRITGMWLDGTPIDLATTYSVTVNSFLSTGGDNFTALGQGTGKQDTGKTDLQAMVDYLAEFANTGAGDPPLPVPSKQNGIGVAFPAGAPTAYAAGAHVLFDVTGWSFASPSDPRDTTVDVSLGGTPLGSFALDQTAPTANPSFDDIGKAAVDVTIPAGAAEGARTLTLTGATTGTVFEVPITVDDGVEQIQIIGTNDFHGRIAKDPTSAAAGAGVMAGAVNQLRGENPNTVFAAAGDLIGASTFESFIQNDKPTIDALNAAGLDVSSVGNHEFDQGYDDLVNRVMAAESQSNPDGGAEWQYLGANVRFKASDDPALPATWTKDFGAVRVGFVGTVTEHLPELVSPGGIEDITVTDIVEETNAAADDLKTNQEADIVIMLVHEGAPNTNCTDIGNLAPTTDFGSIVQGVNDNVDAIVSGHTHLAYNCSFVVPGWSTRAVKERPVVSAGQYGSNLNKLVFTVDSATGAVTAKTQSLLALKSCSASACGGNGQPAWVESYPTDQPVQQVVDAAVAASDVLGNVAVGQLAGPIRRAYLADGSTENRGAESALGNLVAEAQKWQTSGAEAGSAQIAFMNPGGLRADMVGTGTTYPRTLTFKQAAVVQPFANGLVNMRLTGTQIKNALEQQWQPGGASRPFLKLGISKGFTYTSDPDNAQGSRITGMWLDGVPLVPATVYSVTVNSFLATGGDNFGAFAGGTNKAEAGLTDLQAMVNYLDEFANSGEGDAPLAVPSEQNGVHVDFPATPPASYPSGTDVPFAVSGWSFTTPPVDSEIVVKLGTKTIGSFALDNAPQAALPGFDITGKASIAAHLPGDTPVGPATLTLTGATTGTEIPVTVTVGEGQEVVAEDVTVTIGQPADLTASVLGNHGTPTGTVEFFEGATSLGAPVALASGTATLTQAAGALSVGTHTIRAEYSGGGGYAAGQVEFTVTVQEKAVVDLSVTTVRGTYGKPVPVKVTVSGSANPGGTVQVKRGAVVIGQGTLVGGTATITLPAKLLPPGSTSLTAVYSGDAGSNAATKAFTQVVDKAEAELDVKIKPDPFKAGKTKGKIVVKVTADGVVPTGKVKIKVEGKGTFTVKLENGKAVLVLSVFKQSGRRDVEVKYLGDTFVGTAEANDKIKVQN